MKAGTQNRVKKSYSISVESEAYVRRYRRARKISSDSEALDRLLAEASAAEKLATVDAAYNAHYDQATGTDLKEETAWAEFAAGALNEVEWKA